jgi:GTP cyclohydrolase IA
MAVERSATQAVEGEVTPEQAVVALLRHLGEDPAREGLLKTPHRVVKALTEMTAGYWQEPEKILCTVFSEACDEMVVLRDIPFVSLCEHHMLPFVGAAHVAYLPAHNVVGLSKLARLVDCYAKRLQVQERLTRQITQALDEHLKPRGSAAVIEAAHQCMSCRGVGKTGSRMVTSSLSGAFREDPMLRGEFLSLVNR